MRATLVSIESSPARRRILVAADAEMRSVLGAAPVLVIAFARLSQPGAEGQRDEHLAGGGAAVQNLLLALSAQGLASSWISPRWFGPALVEDLAGGADAVALGAVVAGWPLRRP